MLNVKRDRETLYFSAFLQKLPLQARKSQILKWGLVT